MAFFINYAFVNTTCSNIICFSGLNTRKTFVMT